MNEKDQYPIGRYIENLELHQQMQQQWIATIALLPFRIKEEVQSLTQLQLDTPYRENGWTLRQVIHHLADSNINCFARIKFALTEENPSIKPFAEKPWADLFDAKLTDIAPSLKILEGIHERWVALLENLKEKDWQKSFFHPELQKNQTIAQAMDKYSWHCKHHLAHIVNTKEKMGWN